MEAAPSPAVIAARSKIEGLVRRDRPGYSMHWDLYLLILLFYLQRAMTAATYKTTYASQEDMGPNDLPERSDAAILALLDAIQGAGGVLPMDIDPPFGEPPKFIVAFGTAWAEAHAALMAAEAAACTQDLSARDILSRSATEPRTLHPAPSNKDTEVDAAFEARGARVLAEANDALAVAANALAVAELKSEVASLRAEVKALSARKALPSLRDFPAGECRAAGYDAAQLKSAGFSAAELKVACAGAAELKAGGFSAPELKAAGFSAAELSAASFSGASIAQAFDLVGRKAACATARELRAEGFAAAELKSAGFTAAELKATGFRAAELKAGGFSASELMAVGFSAAELKAGGVDNGDLYDLGFRCRDGHDRRTAVCHCGTCQEHGCCSKPNPFR